MTDCRRGVKLIAMNIKRREYKPLRRAAAVLLACCFMTTFAFAEEEEADLRLVHPYSAMARSAVLPGWGQFTIGEPLQGSFFGAATIGLFAGWWVARSNFKDMYDNEYLPAIRNHGITSPTAKAVYNRVNERYKISQFFLFAGIGVWAYGLIDAYIDANIHNAEVMGKRVMKESEQLNDFTIFSVGEQLGGAFQFRF